MGIRLTIRAIHPDGTRATSQLELDQARIALGRAASSDVLLPHASVSQLHATIRVKGAGYVLVDENSTNGSYIEGVRLVAERERTLRSGEVIQIGPFEVELMLGVAVAPSMANAAASGRRLLHSTTRILSTVSGPGIGASFELPDHGENLVIGRAEDAFVHLDDRECSRVHAFLDVARDVAIIRDAESKNGVLVNGKPIAKRSLRDGDELLLGGTTLRYTDPAARELLEISRLEIDAPCDPPLPPVEMALEGQPSLVDAEGVEPLARGIEIVESEVFEQARASAAPREEKKPAEPGVLADRLAFGLALAVLVLSIVGFFLLFGDTPH